MDRVMNDMEVIYAYTRQDAIEDGVIIDVTEYIKQMGINLTEEFDSVFFTDTLFSDISSLPESEAFNTVVDIFDLVDRRESVKIALMKHFNLPKGKIKIRSSKESDKYVLEVCYASED
jgi:hypothetical protein